MRNVMKLLLVFLVILCAVYPVEAQPRLAVRTFEDRTQEQDAPASAIMDMMITELNKAGVFDLVERESFDDIAEELELSQSGLVDPSMVLEVGKLHSAQYTMRGAITLYYYNEKAKGFLLPVIGSAAIAKTAYVLLEIRIFSNTTGKVVYTSDQLGSSRQDSKGNLAGYKGFFIGGYQRTYGGILASAARDAVLKQIDGIRAHHWDE